ARPPAPVVLASSQRVLYSDSAGLVSVPVAADARFGAVLVNMIAYAGASFPLQLELQRLWAPPGWVASASAAKASSASYQRLRRRVISSPRNLPTD
ncbi:MAG TPA: hypothetical protein VLC12_11655, partial [Terriglobales bacterium]|nr:hypothetical protein [Terriglobales bacterium]